MLLRGIRKKKGRETKPRVSPGFYKSTDWRGWCGSRGVKGRRMMVHGGGSAQWELSWFQQEQMSFHSLCSVKEVVRENQKINNKLLNEFSYVDFTGNKNITVSQFASLYFQKYLTGACLVDILVLGNPLSFCICTLAKIKSSC